MSGGDTAAEGVVYTTLEVPELSYMAWERDDAGTVALGGETMVPGPIYGTDYGASIGPFHVATESGDKRVLVDGCEFKTKRDSLLERLLSGASAGAVAGAAATHEHDDSGDSGARLTRRDLLTVVGAGIGAAALSGNVRASDGDSTEFTLAKFHVREATGNVEFRLNRVLEHVLPPRHDYRLVVDGAKHGSITRSSPKVVVPKRRFESPTTVEIKRGGSVVEEIRSILLKDHLKYALSLPELADLPEGTELPLSTDRLVTEPIEASGPDKSQLKIGGEYIPHPEETTVSDVGHYYVVDDDEGKRLVYRVGESPPDSTEAELVVDSGFREELRDDASRII